MCYFSERDLACGNERVMIDEPPLSPATFNIETIRNMRLIPVDTSLSINVELHYKLEVEPRLACVKGRLRELSKR